MNRRGHSSGGRRQAAILAPDPHDREAFSRVRLLVAAHPHDQVHVGKRLLCLHQHPRVAHVKHVEDAVGVNPLDVPSFGCGRARIGWSASHSVMGQGPAGREGGCPADPGRYQYLGASPFGAMTRSSLESNKGASDAQLPPMACGGSPPLSVPLTSPTDRLRFGPPGDDMVEG